MLVQESGVTEVSGNHALLFHCEVINILVHNLQSMASFKWFEYYFVLKSSLINLKTFYISYKISNA